MQGDFQSISFYIESFWNQCALSVKPQLMRTVRSLQASKTIQPTFDLSQEIGDLANYLNVLTHKNWGHLWHRIRGPQYNFEENLALICQKTVAIALDVDQNQIGWLVTEDVPKRALAFMSKEIDAYIAFDIVDKTFDFVGRKLAESKYLLVPFDQGSLGLYGHDKGGITYVYNRPITPAGRLKSRIHGTQFYIGSMAP